MSYDLREDAAEAEEAADDDPGARPASRSATSSPGWRRPRVRHVPPHRRTFHRFYREHFGLVWSMVRRFGVPSAQHEDAVQEVWIVAHRRLHTLEPDASAKAWLSSIARRVASRLRRTDHRQQRKLDALGHAVERSGSLAPPSLEGPDARRLLDALLAALDDEQREVLVLAQIHGLTGPELAQALEIPLNTAYSRLRLARRRVDRFAAELGAERAAVVAQLRRGEHPPAQAQARVWLGLAPKLGLSIAGAGTGTVSATVAVGGGGVFGLKSIVLAVALSVAGLGVARAVVDARAAAPGEVAIAAAARSGSTAHAGGRSAATEPSTSTAERGDAPSTAVASAWARDADGDGAGVEPRESLERRPSRSRSSAPASASQPSGSPSASPDPSSSSGSSSDAVALATLTAESELLGRAARALRSGDAGAALRLLEEHERRFPRGELRDERRGARVRALCGLGRAAQARAEARSLLRDRPHSPVAAGVADVCS